LVLGSNSGHMSGEFTKPVGGIWKSGVVRGSEKLRLIANVGSFGFKFWKRKVGEMEVYLVGVNGGSKFKYWCQCTYMNWSLMINFSTFSRKIDDFFEISLISDFFWFIKTVFSNPFSRVAIGFQSNIESRINDQSILSHPYFYRSLQNWTGGNLLYNENFLPYKEGSEGRSFSIQIVSLTTVRGKLMIPMNSNVMVGVLWNYRTSEDCESPKRSRYGRRWSVRSPSKSWTIRVFELKNGSEQRAVQLFQSFRQHSSEWRGRKGKLWLIHRKDLIGKKKWRTSERGR
jgi:hypothetical protein